MPALIDAAKEGNVENIDKLMRGGANIQEKDGVSECSGRPLRKTENTDSQ